VIAIAFAAPFILGAVLILAIGYLQGRAKSGR
jgi:hypothetical protein